METIGMIEHRNAISLHGNILPNKYTKNKPLVADIPASAVNGPRTDGSLKLTKKNMYISHFCLYKINQQIVKSILPYFTKICNNWCFH